MLPGRERRRNQGDGRDRRHRHGFGRRQVGRSADARRRRQVDQDGRAPHERRHVRRDVGGRAEGLCLRPHCVRLAQEPAVFRALHVLPRRPGRPPADERRQGRGRSPLEGRQDRILRQQIFEHNVETGERKLAFNLKGISSPAAISPDGTKVAIAASFQGNPELYVLSGGRYTRLTNTRTASEGQPTWSPDGTQIAYVSDETRHPQIYVVDVATKAKRRLTSKGSQNVDPDWGADGRITYITKRGGLAQVAVMDPKAGEQSAKLVTSPGSWEHPVWSRDGRHLVAGRDKALFVVDSVEKEDGGDEPRQLFRAAGNWITPTWIR